MKPSQPGRASRWWLWGPGLVLLAALAWTFRPASTAAPAAGVERLAGRWLRPDGGYVVDIRGGRPSGQLEALYFNPGPIHVSRAEWRREGDGLHVFVELRDANYPGATYDLRYLPERDLLVGRYTQPLVGQTFDVTFVRQTQ